jgi:hypothetical protein
VFESLSALRDAYNLGVRWFTRDHHEDPDFDGWETLKADYWAYIESIRSGLPPDLRRLADIDLHDAVLDIAEIDLRRRTAHIRFLAGNRAKFIDCYYADADFGDSNLRNLGIAIEARVPQRDNSGTAVGWKPLASVLHDEITRKGDRFQHSFLIDPLGDFAVGFQGFTLSTEPATEERMPERIDRFRISNQWSED